MLATMTLDDVVASVDKLELSVRVLIGLLVFAFGWANFRYWTRRRRTETPWG